MKRIWTALLCCWLMHEERALAQVLPRGIGVINLGARQVWADSGYYDDNGDVRTLGYKLDIDFEPSTMRSGKAGTDLKKLYDNIKKYDTNSGSGQNSIGDKLNLGSQKGIVKPSIAGKIFGIGFGVAKNLTLFAGTSFLDVKNDTDIEFSGPNNASEIKAQLGDAAFDELKAGLDEASKLSRDTVLSLIHETNQYKDISHWQYKGLGDTQVGFFTGLSRPIRRGQTYSLGVQGQLTLPTGPAYDPDSLTQIPLSQNTKSLGLSTDNRITWSYFAAGAELGGDYNFPFDRLQRVPEDGESLIPITRKTRVHIQPGPSTNASLYSLFGNATYRGQYKFGLSRIYASKFSGSMAGDYNSLGSATASNEAYQELSMIITTVKIYKQRKFFAPFILTLTGHDSVFGSNTSLKKYIQLTLIVIFSSPMAGS